MTLIFREGGDPLMYYHVKPDVTAGHGATGYITMKEAGTNFGARLTSEQVLKAFAEAKRVGQRLPFDIMAAGYGQDEDWVGLDPDDVDDYLDKIDVKGFEENGWGPFEVYAETRMFDVAHGGTSGFIVSPPEWVQATTTTKYTKLSGSQAKLDAKTPKVDSIVPADVMAALTEAGYVIVHPDLDMPGQCSDSDTGYHYINTGMCSGCLQSN